jgi:hypothetical protein
MRVIAVRPEPRVRPLGRFGPPAAFTLVGLGSGVLVAAGVGAQTGSLAAFAAAEPLGHGIGGVLAARAIGHSDGNAWRDRELIELLGSTLDDRWRLLLRPALPGIGPGLSALLVGPPGVRALVVRTWHGRYRLRGRRWEYDTRGRQGWIKCLTDPGYEAVQARDAVARWASERFGQLPIEPLVAFPRRVSQVQLEEPEVEIVTRDNAPWWANSIGQVQRLDEARVAEFSDAVLAAASAPRRKTPSAP